MSLEKNTNDILKDLSFEEILELLNINFSSNQEELNSLLPNYYFYFNEIQKFIENDIDFDSEESETQINCNQVDISNLSLLILYYFSRYPIEKSIHENEFSTWLEKQVVKHKVDNLIIEFVISIRSITDDILSKIDRRLFTAHFSDFFEYFLEQELNTKGKISGIDILPKEIIKIITSIAELPKNAKIYNPFAGLGSFGIHFSKKTSYFGQELCDNNVNLAQLRLLAHNQDNAKIEQGDSIVNWSPKNEKYDLIVANPPFGLKNIVNNKNERISIEQFLIENALKSINKEGKIIATISTGFLFRGGKEKQLRKFLIDNDLIEMIILMPNNLLKHTGVNFAVIVINNNKTLKKQLTFIDATSLVLKTTNKSINILENNKISLIASLLKEGYNNKIPENLFKEVKNNSIVESEYDLTPLKYFLEEINGVKLSELLEEIRFERIERLGESKLINIKHLKDETLNFYADFSKIESSNRKIKFAYKLNKSCLLLSKIGLKLKPTYYKHDKNNNFYLSHNILAFDVNTKKVDLDFLISELHNKSVKKQLKAYSKGAAHTFISKNDLLSIKIQLPKTLKEQKEKVQRLKEIFFDAKKRELELQKEILGLKDDSFKEFASIKHTLRQYLNDLKSNVAGTRKFILKNIDKNITLDMTYSKHLDISFKNHLLSLESTIDSMSKILTDFDEVKNDSISEIIDLETILREAQNRTKKPSLFMFEKIFIADDDFFINDSDREMYAIPPHVRFNKEDFYSIFSNIISNAINHGFTENKEYRIRTSLKPDYENKLWIIEIENNGNLIPNDFTDEHLKIRGEKTSNSGGNGIGGNDIYNLLKKHRASFELLTDNSTNFKVKYQIKIPFIETSELTI